MTERIEQPRLLVPIYSGIWAGPFDLPLHVLAQSDEAMLMWYNYSRRVSVISAYGEKGIHLSMTSWPKDWRPTDGYPKNWKPERANDETRNWILDQFDPLDAYVWTELTKEGIVARHFFAKDTEPPEGAL